MRQRRRAAIGPLLAGLVIGGYSLVALGVWAGLWGGDWAALAGAMWEAPSWRHPLGTNRLGQDIFARALVAIARSFEIGLPIAALSILVGAALGSIAGWWHRGWLDELVLWLAGLFEAIPFYLLVIALAFALHGHGLAMQLAMVLAFWTTTARLVRAEILRLRAATFIEAARVSGLSEGRIILRHLLPHAAPLLLIQASIVFVVAIKAEVVLSFLGLGGVERVSWGVIIVESTQEILAGQYMNFATASLLLLALVLAVNYLIDRAQLALDPRSGRNDTV